MSWNDTCPMNERFVVEIQRGERSMRQLCEDFGISRKTGYKLWRHYENETQDRFRPGACNLRKAPWDRRTGLCPYHQDAGVKSFHTAG